MVKYDNWSIDRSLFDKITKLVQMIVTIYIVQAYQLPIVNPIWPLKIQDVLHQLQFFFTFQHQPAVISRASSAELHMVLTYPK